MKITKNIYLENIIPLDHCNRLEEKVNEFIRNDLYDKNVNSYEAPNDKKIDVGNPYEKLNFFSSNEEYLKFKQDLTDKIQPYYDRKLIYSHEYLRVYYNDSNLKIHTDRPGLDVTLSVNIGGLDNWEIKISKDRIPDEVLDALVHIQGQSFVENYKKNYETFLTPKGCGVVCDARDTPHWRDKLICKDDEYVMQIFYHWTAV